MAVEWITDIGNFVLDFVSWGVAIVIILMVWEVFSLIAGFGSPGSGAEKVHGWFKKKMPWTEEARELRAEKHEKTSLLNQYLEGRTELENIEIVYTKLEEFEGFIQDVETKKSFGDVAKRKETNTKYYHELDVAFKSVDKEVRRLDKRAWRAKTGLTQFQKELEVERGVKADSSEWKEIEAEENKIVVTAGRDIKLAVATARAALNNVGTAAGKIEDGRNTAFNLSDNFSGGVTIQSLVDVLKTTITHFASTLDVVKQEQEEIYKLSEALLAKMRKAVK